MKPHTTNSMKLLEGKNALVTGGGKGIGRGIVEAMADEGANVAFTYLSSEGPAKELEAQLQEKGVKAKALKSDASDFAQAEALIKSFLEEFDSLDALVNNAGITRDGLLMRMGEENFDQVVNTNLKSVFNLTKAANRTLMKQRGGSIINLSSIIGIRGNAGQSNYAASKAGIIGFTKSIALELGSRNVRCNAIAPGFIETEMTEKLDPAQMKEFVDTIPLKRTGTPEDVAQLAVFLASERSSYITGQVLQVDGGLLT